MKRLQPYLPAIGIFCLALLVRLVYNLAVARNYVPQYDSQVYEKLALHLSQYGCFCFYPNMPITARAPLWPAVIASIYGLFGFPNFYVRLFLCLIDAGTCVLVYLWA